ncbi:DUF4012 domain-containing protein [Skermania piniformis]
MFDLIGKLASRRRLAIGIAAVMLLLGLCLWIGLATAKLRNDVLRAEERAAGAKSSLLQGDASTARQTARLAIDDLDQARADAGSAPLSWIAAAPIVGSPIVVVEKMIDVVKQLATDVLLPIVDSPAATVVAMNGPDRHIDPAALRAALPALQQSVAAATDVAVAARDIPRSSYLGAVNHARDDLMRQTADLAAALAATNRLAPVLPAMTGADGPRTYLLVFQTNAEARGTGGLMGGTALLRVENGVVKVEKPASNLLALDYRPIDLGADFAKMYGTWNPTSNWQNANFSPHFPYAAQIWRSIWSQYSGVTVDGVIATDPVALSYLLAGLGPVQLPDGESIDATNVVPLTQNELYFRFPAENEQLTRKEYLQEISKAVIEAVNKPWASADGVLDGLRRAVAEGRIAMWSAVPDEQRALATLPIAHEVPADSAPYANVVVNNGAGGKLDYYLQRDIAYSAAACDGDDRASTVSVKLTNTAPPRDDYPSYVAGRRTPQTQYDGPPGTNRSVVSLFATQGATLERATINGVPAPFALEAAERGHPTYSVTVLTRPGESATVTWNLREPTAAGAARVPVQPLVLPAKVSVDVPTCP